MSNTSGISLTAMIEKDEVGGGGYSVRAGSIVLAKNAIFAANEIGDLDFKNQLYLGDIMEEGLTHISKYTIDARLVAPVTMIAACNPTGTYWKNPDRIEMSEIPLPPKEIDRYDLIFVFRMPREKEQLKAFAFEISECDKNYLGPIDYTFLKKVILYSKQFKPKLTDEAIIEIQNYWIEIASKRGSVRIKNVLERLSKALAKLNFKNISDIDDAKEALRIHKHMISQFEEFG
jgi:DNA replicative helicase MCM subunit Mcm2 (Cdc46/Mcm family)